MIDFCSPYFCHTAVYKWLQIKLNWPSVDIHRVFLSARKWNQTAAKHLKKALFVSFPEAFSSMIGLHKERYWWSNSAKQLLHFKEMCKWETFLICNNMQTFTAKWASPPREVWIYSPIHTCTCVHFTYCPEPLYSSQHI